MVTKKYLKQLTYDVLGAAIEVHKHLGAGLLESVYHKCLLKEFIEQSIPFQSEVNVPVQYKGLEVSTDLRCDFFVQDILVVELKAVDSILPIHEAQLLTYMKLLKAPKGILLNFNAVNLFRCGQKTFVNEYFTSLIEG
ncbi:GxxExxY protein [Rapidithrix thailandica]|uniref:GxxExxY protein n=1 Tax=Rapidithrix thailandica TaxID=413964 RepID=A0AAW9S0W1_9BACT